MRAHHEILAKKIIEIEYREVGNQRNGTEPIQIAMFYGFPTINP